MTKRETYLGDGLYASFDGYQITLRTLRIGGDHWVALQSEVYREFLRFVASLESKEFMHHQPKRTATKAPDSFPVGFFAPDNKAKFR